MAPTYSEARLVMMEGKSGLLSIDQGDDRPAYEPSKRQLTWPNGSVAHVFSAEEPDGLRGPQFDAAWCDELAKWKHANEVWNMLQFALRLGDNPRAIITTTPRPIPILKRLLAESGTVVSRSTTFDNRKNLAKPFLDEVLKRYGGTRLGRQELNGELIEDDPDALFHRDIIENLRVASAPELRRVVVAVDPPAGFGARSNACGIVCAGLGVDGRCYVLDDYSVHGLRPAQWAKKIVGLYHARKADRVVAEVNQGGAMVEQVLREVDPELAFRAVHATRGKQARAEPVAALYEQGRVSHVGAFAELEDEMCQRHRRGPEKPRPPGRIGLGRQRPDAAQARGAAGENALTLSFRRNLESHRGHQSFFTTTFGECRQRMVCAWRQKQSEGESVVTISALPDKRSSSLSSLFQVQ